MVMFTTDPIYRRPLIPRITIKSLDNATTYYTYDPWTDSGTTTKAIGCSVNLSQNHQGIFEVQIEDETGAISTNAGLGARCIIECGKQSTQMTRLISGLIRQQGVARGADRKRILTLSGSSTAIRLNEKILYYVNEAAKLAQDGITIDINDVTRKADLLLQTGLASLTTEAIINAGGVVASSDVENFIASLAIEYGEAQDLCNTIEEQSNGEIFVDANDVVQFKHTMQPPIVGKGFTIKNKNAANDNADDTCYLRGKNWDYTESCLKSDGYSNRIYGILPVESAPSTKEDIGFQANNAIGGEFALTQNAGVEVAYKFRPTHSHWLPGDIYAVCAYIAAVAVLPWTARFRIILDSGAGPDPASTPRNVGGVVANIDFPGTNESFGKTQTSPPPHTDPAWNLSNDQIFYNSSNTRIDYFDLDTTKDYWILISDDNIPAGGAPTNTFAISYKGNDVVFSTAIIAFHNTNLSTNSAGGSSYTLGTQRLPAFAFPRVRAQAFECSDSKAIAAIGCPIESTLSGVPATIKTREGMYRYMVNQSYYMARPRVNWNMATVTAPNIPILPGDPILISDSVMGFSASGGQAVMATCGDMTYSWQIGQYQAPTILSIQPVTNPTHYS